MYTIYKIENIKSKMFYIGSTNNFFARKAEHLSQLRKGKHINKKLQHAFDEFKEDNFIFSILFENISSREKVLLKEYEIILKTWDQNYNIDKYCPVISKKKNKNKVFSKYVIKQTKHSQRLIDKFKKREINNNSHIANLKEHTPDKILQRKIIREKLRT